MTLKEMMDSPRAEVRLMAFRIVRYLLRQKWPVKKVLSLCF